MELTSSFSLIQITIFFSNFFLCEILVFMSMLLISNFQVIVIAADNLLAEVATGHDFLCSVG